MIFVLAIIAMGIIGGILKARYGHRDDRDRDLGPRDDGETRRLKEDVSALKERLQVLERTCSLLGAAHVHPPRFIRTRRRIWLP
jgi:hypothetical protein